MAPKCNAQGSVSVGERQEGVAESYDASSRGREETRGEHFHHGFYGVAVNNNNSKKDVDHGAALIRTIEEAVPFAGISNGPNPDTLLDVGGGTGGSSRYLAKEDGATVAGITLITLRPIEVHTPNVLAAAEGLADRVNIQVADALDQAFPDGQFARVRSVECPEHVPDKDKFMRELVRVAAPGGSIILETFCHRDLLPGGVSLQPSEQELLDKTCEAYHVPVWSLAKRSTLSCRGVVGRVK